MTRWVGRILTNRNQWLLAAFGAFLFLILLFALLYYSAYRSDRSNFLFAADITSRQSQAIASESNSRLSDLSVLEVGVTKALRHVDPRDTTRIVRLGVRRFPIGARSTLAVGMKAMGGGTYRRVLFIEDSSGHRIESPSPGFVVGAWPTLPQLLNTELDDVEAEMASVQARLLTIPSRLPDVWGFSDFLYFSVITQGTVGYGDILPNSRYIRVLVTVQVLTSYLVVLVLLNWAVVRTSSGSATSGV